MSSRSVALGVLAVLVYGGLLAPGLASADPGTVYTTDLRGTNNQNTHYGSKADVFLTAGACKGGSRLADGAYYFEVTDPSTKRLLSTDALASRRFEVSGGVIVGRYGSRAVPTTCGATTDQYLAVMPFANTTSRGGEYKLSISPVAGIDACALGSIGGCPHAATKTDTFKVNFDVAVSTRVSATRIALGSNVSVTDGIAIAGTAAEGYPHGTVAVHLCRGASCSPGGTPAVGTSTLIASFDLATGRATKDVATATGAVSVNVRTFPVGTYTFYAAYEPAVHVAYNPAGDPGTNETFEIYAPTVPTPTPTSPTPRPSTPLPTGSVAGVTSPPKPSLPPTDATSSIPAEPADGVTLALLGLLAVVTLVGTLRPMTRTGGERRARTPR